MNRKSKILLFSGFILLVVISPILLTLPNFWKYLDFSETGQIGDTIGGITAPFINLLGAVLVYLSFNEQLKANKIQEKALLNEIRRNNNEKRFNSIIHDIDNLRKDINDYKLIGKGHTETGPNAIFEFKEILRQFKSSQSFRKINIQQMADNIGLIVKSANDTLNRIEESGLNEDDVKNLKNKLIFLYSSKVGLYVEDIVKYFKMHGAISPTLSVMSKIIPRLSSELLESDKN